MKTKQKKANTNRANAKPVKSAPAKVKAKRAGILTFLGKHLWLTVLVLLWAFLFFFYGDTLQVAQQRSFLVFDSTAMNYWLCQPLGWLYVTGRFMLVSCVWPAVGALLIAAMLTLSAKLLDKALRPKGWRQAIVVALPFAYFGFYFYQGLNLFYLREPSYIMTVPLIALAVCAAVALIAKMKGKKSQKVESLEPSVEGQEPNYKPQLLTLGVLWIACAVIAMTYAQNDRLTCAMECKMMQQDWDSMVEIAKKASRPSRTVAAYHALALNQNGQAATELFNLRYQYPNAHLSRRHGEFDGGMDYFVIDCNFYAGLTRSAYHEAMEQNVLEGPTIHRIKRMVQCAVIDKENALAEKYLAILKKAPFEGDFVEKYSAMLRDYNLVLQDSELASVIELQPVHDSFEQTYREPMFLGYNLALTEAKSMRGLHNSLYACLYTKDMLAFGSRIITMIEGGVPLPKIYEEAIVVQNIKNLAVLKQINLSPYTLQEFKDFMSECFSQKDRDVAPKVKAKEHDQYLGSYEYYYYLQNIADENYALPEDEKKGGVN